MTTKILVPRIQRDSSVSSSNSELTIRSTPGRKRKLDHLTQEEKVQRKKLKNRVAAQTSRDRKKKQMEEMLITIERQTKELSQWEHRYNQLKTKYDKLEREVAKLKQANKNSNNTKQESFSRNSIPEEHKTCCVPTSAEGINDENRDDRKISNQRFSEEEKERCEGLIEGNNALPTLQELIDGINFEYDLEELAESLVSELHSNMEINSATGNCANAKEDSNECELSRPMVDEPMSWSRKSRMESAKDRHRSSLKQRSSSKRLHDAKTSHNGSDNETYNVDKIFYDDEIPVVKDECFGVEEMIICDDSEEDDTDCLDICSKFKSSPVDRLISPIPHSDYDDIKSPLHTISDGGYESQGSPISLDEFTSLNDPQNDFDLLINDLFPSLVL
ncbi:hypothetical protein PVAND_008210 [Polypedilum vanderplanki]|uniref:X-box-binding protein 1 n=1 Tax=Polypedilum vanderplanki TaxID=319348 RepID=A0A9J6C9A7_POLVA|nr:hypothetical protein PVAND_008210 [Polypedilum vanderplanki]